MNVLKGLPTPAFQRVVDARRDFFNGVCTLEHAVRVFDEAARQDDPFVRWELQYLKAHPLRRVHDHAIPTRERLSENAAELAEAGNPLAQLTVVQSIGRMKDVTRVSPVVVGFALQRAQDMTFPLSLVMFCAYHYQTTGMSLLVEFNLTRACLRQVSEAGWMDEALEWSGQCSQHEVKSHQKAAYQYGRSRYFRHRTGSTCPMILCERVDSTCRRAVLCWLWARVLPKDVRMLVAREVWESRFDAGGWVHEEGEQESKRIKF